MAGIWWYISFAHSIKITITAANVLENNSITFEIGIVMMLISTCPSLDKLVKIGWYPFGFLMRIIRSYLLLILTVSRNRLMSICVRFYFGITCIIWSVCNGREYTELWQISVDNKIPNMFAFHGYPPSFGLKPKTHRSLMAYATWIGKKRAPKKKHIHIDTDPNVCLYLFFKRTFCLFTQPSHFLHFILILFGAYFQRVKCIYWFYRDSFPMNDSVSNTFSTTLFTQQTQTHARIHCLCLHSDEKQIHKRWLYYHCHQKCKQYTVRFYWILNTRFQSARCYHSTRPHIDWLEFRQIPTNEDWQAEATTAIIPSDWIGFNKIKKEIRKKNSLDSDRSVSSGKKRREHVPTNFIIKFISIWFAFSMCVVYIVTVRIQKKKFHWIIYRLRFFYWHFHLAFLLADEIHEISMGNFTIYCIHRKYMYNVYTLHAYKHEQRTSWATYRSTSQNNFHRLNIICSF